MMKFPSTIIAWICTAHTKHGFIKFDLQRKGLYCNNEMHVMILKFLIVGSV